MTRRAWAIVSLLGGCNRFYSGSDVVGSPKRAEQMQTINGIFKYPLFRTKTDVFMLNVPILQLRPRSRHNPDIRAFVGSL